MRLNKRTIHADVLVGTTRYHMGAEKPRPLHIEIDIRTTRQPTPNQAEVTIYNPPEELRTRLHENRDEPAGLEVYAGYGDSVEMIFRGTVKNVHPIHDPAGPDWKLTIKAGDGEKEFTSVYFDRMYRKSADIIGIFRDIADELGMAADITDVLIGQKLIRDRTFACLAKDALDRLADEYSVKWSIQLGRLEVTFQNNAPRGSPTAVVLTPTSGLSQYPSLVERAPRKGEYLKGKAVDIVDPVKRKGKPQKRVLGVQCSCFLIPQLRPNRLAKIETPVTMSGLGGQFVNTRPYRDASGLYIIDSAHYTGNNFGTSDDFGVVIRADILET